MRQSLTFGIIGQTGQLALALKRELDSTPHKGVFLNRQKCDLAGNVERIEPALGVFLSCDAIIIAAAYTQVDAAEEDEDMTMAVNAIAPGVIAEWAVAKDIPIIYISTDYVFSGTATIPYAPHSPTDPINIYGRSKSLGEQAVRAAQPHSAILRTSWLYDGLGQNFLTTMLKFAQSRESVDVVSDQIGRPTYAGHLAQAVISFAEDLTINAESFTGTFHISGSGAPVSWAGFAREIFKVFADELPYLVTVRDVPSSAFPTSAKRPAYSVLGMSKTEALLGQSLPDWREGVKAAKRERQANG